MRLHHVVAAAGTLLAPQIALAQVSPVAPAPTGMRLVVEKQDPLRDLLSILDRHEQEAARLPRLITRPYGTTYRGLCRRDILSISYAPPGGVDAGTEASAPYGFSARALYAAVSRPAVPDRTGNSGTPSWSAECRRLDGERAHWFTADDATIAFRGYRALHAMLERLAAGSLSPDCSAIGSACRNAILSNLGADRLVAIKPRPAPLSSRCFAIDGSGDVSVRITVASFKVDDPTPDDIKSVEAERYIVVN